MTSQRHTVVYGSSKKIRSLYASYSGLVKSEKPPHTIQARSFQPVPITPSFTPLLILKAIWPPEFVPASVGQCACFSAGEPRYLAAIGGVGEPNYRHVLLSIEVQLHYYAALRMFDGTET
jgi:hypothetical protein